MVSLTEESCFNLLFVFALTGGERRQDCNPDMPLRAPQAQDHTQAGHQVRRGLQETQGIREGKILRDGQAGKSDTLELLWGAFHEASCQ